MSETAVRTQDAFVPPTKARCREHIFARFATTTRGKMPALARAIELAGRDHPKRLAGPAFAVRSLAPQVTQIRTGTWHAPDEGLRDAREK